MIFLLLLECERDLSAESAGEIYLLMGLMARMFSTDFPFFLLTNFWLVLFDLSIFFSTDFLYGVFYALLYLEALLPSINFCLFGVSNIFSFSDLSIVSKFFFLGFFD